MKNSISARSPLSPTLWPRNAFVWWGSLLFLVAMLGGLLAGVVLFVIGWMLLFGLASAQHPTPELAIASQAVVYVVLLVVFVVGLPMLARRSLAELGLRLPGLRDIGWGIAGALAMLIIVEAIGIVEERFFHVKVSETAVDMLKAAHGPALVSFVAFACIVAPFFEELIFRGFVFNALLRYIPFVVAALLSGLLFGAVHALGDVHSLGAVIPLSGGGFVLAWVYYRTGSLASSMISHGLFNATSVIGLLAFHLK